MTEQPWNRETVRAELDAICSAHGIGTFASRYDATAEELLELIDGAAEYSILSDSDRALVDAVLRPRVVTADQAFDRAVRANPAAVGEYLGRVALKSRELTSAADATGIDFDAIDVAFGLVDPPLEMDARNAPTQRERNVVAILMGSRS